MRDLMTEYNMAPEPFETSQRLKSKSRIYKLLGGNPGYVCESYLPTASLGVPSETEICYGADIKAEKFKKVSQWNELYGDLDNRTAFVVIGTTGTVTFDEAPSSPSAYPRFVSGYINQLQKRNQSLESRVGTLESQLAEVQKFLPTIKKLVYEHESALCRVSAVKTELGRKYDPVEAWKIAEERDALSSPPPEDYSELM